MIQWLTTSTIDGINPSPESMIRESISFFAADRPCGRDLSFRGIYVLQTNLTSISAFVMLGNQPLSV